MDLYQKIDAVVKAVQQDRVDQTTENLAQYAEIEAIKQQLSGTIAALNRLVEGLGGLLGVSFEEPKNLKKK